MNLSSDRHTAGSAVVNILLSLVAIAAVGGSVYGTYTWQHRKVDKLDQQVAQLNSELTAATKPQPAPTVTNQLSSKKGVVIKVYVPTSGSSVASPIVVMGEVPGSWSFEASFPVKLLDAKGNIVAQAPAQLLGDWMTDKPVPFTAKLTYTSALSGEGTLLLQKDNPSGLEANDDSASMPLKL